MAKHQGIQDVRPRSLLLGHHRHVLGITQTIDDLKIKGKDFRVNVTPAVVSATLERTIEGASTVTLGLDDPRGKILKTKFLEERADIELADPKGRDSLWFRLVAVSRQGDTINLTFEDREIARLRLMKGPKKAFRDQVTRAEFVLMLLREVKDPRIPAWIPELHEEQPIEKAQGVGKTDRNLTEGQGAKGLDKGANLTVKGQKASSSQIKIGEKALQVAASLKAPALAAQAMIMALIQESVMGAASSNYFQLTGPKSGTSPSAGIESQATAFLRVGFYGKGGAIALSKKMHDPGAIAQAVEGSAFPSAYSQWESEAKRWVDNFRGLASGGGTLTTSRTVAKRYAFERKKNEDSWRAIQRLAEEVRWRAFVSNGIFYYADEKEFLSAKVRMLVNDQAPGIDEINWDWDMGKKVDELTVIGRARDWAAPPGTVADVDDQGPANGLYIVSDIQSNLFDDDVTVTLKRPQKPLPEPAPETKTVTNTKHFPSGGGGKSLSGVHVTAKAGSPHWGGSADVMEQVVYPVARKLNMTIGAKKETGHTPGGDHDPAIRNAFATDFPPGSGHFANAVARALEIEGYHYGNFNHWGFHADGHYFECQILWHVEDHYDHVHVGIRAGGY